jgi:hypothetical protein
VFESRPVILKVPSKGFASFVFQFLVHYFSSKGAIDNRYLMVRGLQFPTFVFTIPLLWH